MTFFVFLQGFDASGLLFPLLSITGFFAVSFFVVSFLNDSFSGNRPKHEKDIFVLKKSHKGEGSQGVGTEAAFAGSFGLEPSSDIVKTIKDLLKNSTPEEEIVANLQSLGLDEKSSKKMVLIAQSDALHVFRNEIEAITKKNVSEQLSKIQEQMSVPSGLSIEEKLSELEFRLSERIEKAVRETKKPRKKIVLSLLELEKKLEELKVPKLKRASYFEEEGL